MLLKGGSVAVGVAVSNGVGVGCGVFVGSGVSGRRVTTCPDNCGISGVLVGGLGVNVAPPSATPTVGVSVGRGVGVGSGASRGGNTNEARSNTPKTTAIPP